MAATTSPSNPAGAAGAAGAAPLPAGRIGRFDRAERIVHWANAVLFLWLLLTGLTLSFGPLSELVGRREIVKTLHVYVGLLLPVPVVAGLLGRYGRALRDDARRLNRWLADDRRWFRTFGQDRSIRLGKFHPGQKLNAAVTAGAIPVMLLSGAVMKWYRPFPLSWRTGATFAHDWVATVLLVFITGHIVKALSDPEALRGMTAGDVSVRWARRHHPRWADTAAPETPPVAEAAARAEPATP
jgi:formate dehydrogenase subunit gamma